MNKSSSSKKGFTLIELLVVISIISLLSSIVLASLNAARTKARIAAGQQLDSNIHHAIGDQLVGHWSFDECSGTTVSDRSSSGNNGTLLNTPGWSTNTFSGKGCALNLNGATQFMSVANSSSLSNYSNGVTISVWINSTTVSGIQGIFAKMGGSEYLDIILINGQIRFETSAGQVIYTNSLLKPNEWYNIVATYDPSLTSNQAKVYINGVLDVQGTIAIANPNNGSNVFIGNYAGYFSGLIDDMKFYSKSLTSASIYKQYAEESVLRRSFSFNQ
jgi:prepilin-type N-terminal cleavage/methylation domain-containing protein